MSPLDATIALERALHGVGLPPERTVPYVDTANYSFIHFSFYLGSEDAPQDLIAAWCENLSALLESHRPDWISWQIRPEIKFEKMIPADGWVLIGGAIIPGKLP